VNSSSVGIYSVHHEKVDSILRRETLLLATSMKRTTAYQGCEHYSPSEFDTILFDLDGTLADTAPDLLFALNRLIREEDGRSLSLEEILPFISHGSRAMVQRGFEMEPDNPDFTRLVERFLDIYHDNVMVHTRLFPGMEKALERIEARFMTWGIVTNKSARFTEPLLAALGLARRAACIVSGDSTEFRKPYPEPLLFACAQTGTTPDHCLYVGDAPKDVEAGKRAGARTAVALFGYISENEAPEKWGADCLISSPQDIVDWLGSFS